MLMASEDWDDFDVGSRFSSTSVFLSIKFTQFPSHLAPAQTQAKIQGNSMDVPVQPVRMIPNIVQNILNRSFTVSSHDSMKLGILTQSFGSRSIWHHNKFRSF